jgi:hypothetical protein
LYTVIQRHQPGLRSHGLRHQQQHSRPGTRVRQQNSLLGIDSGDLGNFEVDDDELQGFRPVRHTDGVLYENNSENFGPFTDDRKSTLHELMH